MPVNRNGINMGLQNEATVAGAARRALGAALVLPSAKKFERLDEPEIKALYLQISGQAIVLLAVDFCVIRRAHSARVTDAVAAALDLPRQHVHLYVTHTHAPGSLKPYDLDALIGLAKSVACEARVSARGVCEAFYLNIDTQSRFNLNRRTVSDELGTWCLMQSVGCRDNGVVVDGAEWVRLKMAQAGASEADLSLIRGPYPANRVCDADLQLVLFGKSEQGYAGGIVRFTAHAVICSSGYWKPNVSRDYPGVLCDRLEAEFGCPILFLQGPTGDHRSRHTAVGLSERDRIGNGLADALLNALPQGSRMPLTVLRVESAAAVCRLRGDICASHDEACGMLARLEEDLRALRGGTLESLRERKRLEEQRWFYNKLVNVPDFLGYLEPKEIRAGMVKLPVSVLRLGDIRMVNLPGELVSTLACGLKDGRSDPVVIAGYADGVTGYILPPDDFNEGGYEATSALVAPESTGCLRDIARQLLARV